VCFKINLDQMKPPAKIDFNYVVTGQLSVYASFKNLEPTSDSNDFSFFTPNTIRIKGKEP